MALVVQKYGGTSIATADRIKHVARRVASLRDQGHDLVVVVSARGDTTDELLELALEITPEPDEREMDLLLSTGEMVSCALLAMALKAIGKEAVSLMGLQAGIRTDAAYNKARITAVEPVRIQRELKKGRVVIVAGFQGVNPEMDITTLGRGGSDTTAVALAARLKASCCEIYTDVEGVYTADPRIAPEARRLGDITFEEMLELASYGAKVLHPRAAELGLLYDIPILVASTFVEGPGTLVCKGVTMEVKNKVRGIAHDLDVAKITLRGVPDRPGIAAAVFEPMAQANISVDTIVQNASLDKVTDLTFTVAKNDLTKAMKVVERRAKQIGFKEVLADGTLGKVSIVGTGMQNTPGYAAKMFRTLSDAGVNIHLITTSEIRITCIVDGAKVPQAVRALHDAFELAKTE